MKFDYKVTFIVTSLSLGFVIFLLAKAIHHILLK